MNEVWDLYGFKYDYDCPIVSLIKRDVRCEDRTELGFIVQSTFGNHEFDFPVILAVNKNSFVVAFNRL